MGNPKSLQCPKPDNQAKHRRYKSADTFMCSVLLALLSDAYSSLPWYCFTDYARDVRTVRRRNLHEGIGFFTIALPTLFDGLTEHLEGSSPSYAHFKCIKSAEYPHFLRGLFKKAYCEGKNDQDDRAKAIKFIYQIAYSFKKLEGPYEDSVLRDELRSFVQDDRVIGAMPINGGDRSIIMNDARKFITRLFADTNPVDDFKKFMPRPGSGATNTPSKQHARYAPRVLYEQLHDVFNYNQYWKTFYQWLELITGEEQCYEETLDSKRVLYPTSKFLFIQKKIKKPRGICMEENETQYFQQAMRRWLYWWIEMHPDTKGRVNFTNQAINQKLALSSSVTREHATLDMSAASDRISRELVLALFRDTSIFYMLEALSTKIIMLPEGLGQKPELLAHKFAPMGSGICFPIMSIVHYALIRAILRCSSVPQDRDSAKDVYVYGDDIIVPTTSAITVCNYLPLFGMKLNTDKSFFRSKFRESCGCHAFNGLDVTPIFFKKIITEDTKSSDSATLSSLIAKEYLARKKGLSHVADYIRQEVHRIYGWLPNVFEDSGLAGWKYPANHADLTPLRDLVKGRRKAQSLTAGVIQLTPNGDSEVTEPRNWLGSRSLGTQCFEYKVRCLRPKMGQVVDLNDEQGLLRKYVMMCKRNAGSVNGEPEDQRLFWSWVPESGIIFGPRLEIQVPNS